MTASTVARIAGAQAMPLRQANTTSTTDTTMTYRADDQARSRGAEERGASLNRIGLARYHRGKSDDAHEGEHATRDGSVRERLGKRRKGLRSHLGEHEHERAERHAACQGKAQHLERDRRGIRRLDSGDHVRGADEQREHGAQHGNDDCQPLAGPAQLAGKREDDVHEGDEHEDHADADLVGKRRGPQSGEDAEGMGGIGRMDHRGDKPDGRDDERGEGHLVDGLELLVGEPARRKGDGKRDEGACADGRERGEHCQGQFGECRLHCYITSLTLMTEPSALPAGLGPRRRA